MAKKRSIKKRTTKKKSTRKKSVRKKTVRKKAPRRTGRKRALKKSPARTQARHDDKIDLEVQVMEAYGRLCSYRQVAAELRVSDWTVRGILEGHRLRVRQMIEEALEKRVARYEQAGEKALDVMHHTLAIALGWIIEIKAAADEGRKTTLLDDDGFPMSVVAAKEYILNSRVMAQVTQIAKTAHDVSMGFRRSPVPGMTGPPPREDELDEGGSGGMPDFGRMSDLEIARTIQRGGLTVPPVLAAKVKALLESDLESDND